MDVRTGSQNEDQFHIKLETKTSCGKRYPHGGIQVEAEMRSTAYNGAVVYGEVEDHRDGTYRPV